VLQQFLDVVLVEFLREGVHVEEGGVVPDVLETGGEGELFAVEGVVDLAGVLHHVLLRVEGVQGVAVGVRQRLDLQLQALLQSRQDLVAVVVEIIRDEQVRHYLLLCPIHAAYTNRTQLPPNTHLYLRRPIMANIRSNKKKY
jgi:hypothetical protein